VQSGVAGVHQGERSRHVATQHRVHDGARRFWAVASGQGAVGEHRAQVHLLEGAVAAVGAGHRGQEAGVLVVADLLGRDTRRARQVDRPHRTASFTPGVEGSSAQHRR
jgi:hypothetical protein